MNDSPPSEPNAAPGPSTSSTGPAPDVVSAVSAGAPIAATSPARRDVAPIVVMIILGLLLVGVATTAVVMGLRSCGGDDDGATAPTRGVPVAGLSGTASPEPSAAATVASPSSRPSSAAPSEDATATASPAEGEAGGWVGTWVIVGDPTAGIVIEADESGFYRAHAPDGGNEVVFVPLGEKRLVASVSSKVDGVDTRVRIILTMNDDGDGFSLQQTGGGETQTWELRRAE